MGISCAECGRSRWAWYQEYFDGSRPELVCTKPVVTDHISGRLVLPATECRRIQPGYGPPQAKPAYFYPWPCEFVASGYAKQAPSAPGLLQQLGGLFGRTVSDGLGPDDGLYAYAESLGAEVGA